MNYIFFCSKGFILSQFWFAQRALILKEQCNFEVISLVKYASFGTSFSTEEYVVDINVKSNTSSKFFWDGDLWILTPSKTKQIQNFNFNGTSNTWFLGVENKGILNPHLTVLSLQDDLVDSFESDSNEKTLGDTSKNINLASKDVRFKGVSSAAVGSVDHYAYELVFRKCKLDYGELVTRNDKKNQGPALINSKAISTFFISKTAINSNSHQNYTIITQSVDYNPLINVVDVVKWLNEPSKIDLKQSRVHKTQVLSMVNTKQDIVLDDDHILLLLLNIAGENKYNCSATQNTINRLDEDFFIEVNQQMANKFIYFKVLTTKPVKKYTTSVTKVGFHRIFASHGTVSSPQQITTKGVVNQSNYSKSIETIAITNLDDINGQVDALKSTINSNHVSYKGDPYLHLPFNTQASYSYVANNYNGMLQDLGSNSTEGLDKVFNVSSNAANNNLFTVKRLE